VSVVVVSGRLKSALAINVYSGTVAQSIVLSLLDAPELHDAKPKPFAVWPLHINKRPVLDGVAAPPGSELMLRAAFAQRELARRLVEAVAERGLKVFNAEVSVEAVEFWDVPRGAGGKECFKVDFLSPTRFETRRYYQRRTPVYDFTPRALSLFHSAVAYGRRFGLFKYGINFLKWVYNYVGDHGLRLRGEELREDGKACERQNRQGVYGLGPL
jgi:CRISPR-associated endoribonuclease Cas6